MTSIRCLGERCGEFATLPISTDDVVPLERLLGCPDTQGRCPRGVVTRPRLAGRNISHLRIEPYG
jgi:hypothetical protein